LSSFTFLLEASLKSVSLDLEEGLELCELLLRLLLHLTEGVLELRGLLLKFSLQLGVPLLGTILAFLQHTSFLGFEEPDLLESLNLDFFRSGQLLS
jgi:hypothetical protein